MRPGVAVVLFASSIGVVLAGCGSGAPHAPPEPLVQVTPEATAHPRVTGRRPAMILVTPPGPSATAPVVAVVESCEVPIPSAFGAGCHLLVPQRITATNSVGTAVNAFDQSWCTSWSAGAMAPQSITVDLGASTDIDGLVLIPEMTQSGSVTHKIEVSDDGVNFESSQRIEAPMSDGSSAELRLPQREHARFVRFATEASPSMVAWKEISVVQCSTR